jgi:hypothetical protein
MTTRYAAPVKVPRLKQKLGAFYLLTRIESDEALGQLFRSESEPRGLTGRAIRNWIDGDGSRDQNHVPANRFPKLVEIVQKHLPGGSRTIAETQAILTSDNERALYFALLDGAPPTDWMELVADIEPGGVEVIRMSASTTFSITARRRALRDVDERITLPIKHPFLFKLDVVGPGCLTRLVGWGSMLSSRAECLKRRNRTSCSQASHRT